ncbi:RluA family pseudouridine synthase [Candidatus Saccharibacteria bacterium]|nr:RluA family pseudouridine synthase [Candidatus Saccharibacteria bacterium]
MSNLEISRAQRLDQKVVELIPEISRSFAAKLIEDGKVTVNDDVQTKAGYKLREDDEVKVDYDTVELEQIPDIDLEVIYEDDDCVVVNKPVGVLTHSKGAYNPEATVATWLRARLKGLEGSRGGIVHRLDRATSGVMICAKTPEALSWLQKQFAQRKTKKTYAAVVQGQMKHEAAIIDMPIERNPKAPATFRVGPQGKSAKTTYSTLKTGTKYSLLELKPETGRTHQLRVHLAHQGHPIVGDVLYDGETANRLYLHAEELEVTIPKDHERKVFRVPVPSSFDEKVRS